MSMTGVSRDLAIEAVQRHGWGKNEVLLVHMFAQHHKLAATKVTAWATVLNDRFLAYRGQDFTSLLLAVLSPPPLQLPTFCYCDGSGTTLEKPAGIGVAVYHPQREQPELISENIGLGTNNRAELYAIWRGLKAVPDITSRVVIRTDSEYAIGALTKDWAKNSHAELITAIRDDLSMRAGVVVFEHVDGHSGVEGNEVADQLAKAGRKWVSTVAKIYDLHQHRPAAPL